MARLEDLVPLSPSPPLVEGVLLTEEDDDTDEYDPEAELIEAHQLLEDAVRYFEWLAEPKNLHGRVGFYRHHEAQRLADEINAYLSQFIENEEGEF